MNGLTFSETPDRRNTPGSFWADERPGDALHEETQAEASRSYMDHEVAAILEEARHSHSIGGISQARLELVEDFALRFGVTP